MGGALWGASTAVLPAPVDGTRQGDPPTHAGHGGEGPVTAGAVQRVVCWRKYGKDNGDLTFDIIARDELTPEGVERVKAVARFYRTDENGENLDKSVQEFESSLRLGDMGDGGEVAEGTPADANGGLAVSDKGNGSGQDREEGAGTGGVSSTRYTHFGKFPPMNPKIPIDRPLYQKLLALNEPEKFLKLIWLFTETPRQEEELLAWLELTGETDLQKIADQMFEVTDPDRQ